MSVALENERAIMGGNKPPIGEVLAQQYRDLVAEIEPIATRANAMPKKIESDADLGPIGDLVVDASKLAKRIEAARKFEKEPHDQAGKAVQAFFVPLKDRLDRIATTFEDMATAYNREKLAAARRKADEEARKLREAEEKKRLEADAAKRESTAERKLDEAEALADKAEEAEAKAQATNAELTKVRTDSGVTAGTKTNWSAEIVKYEDIPLGPLGTFFDEKEVLRAAKSMAKVMKSRAACPGIRFFEDVKSTFRR